MRFGIAVATAADSWRVIERAEALGFDSAWFYDTQMLSADCFVAMGAAAVKTSRIRLGTGVLVPSNRIAPVTANALATLNKLAPGRIDFGVGTGFTARRAMGQGAMRLADLEAYVRAVQALLAGNSVELELEGEPHTVRFLNPPACRGAAAPRRGRGAGRAAQHQRDPAIGARRGGRLRRDGARLRARACCRRSRSRSRR